MTLVNIDLRNADDTPAEGTVRFAPSKRLGVDEHIVLPLPFGVTLVEGVAAVELLPTGPDWVWHVIEHTRARFQRYVAVQDSASPVLYTDLIDVDPSTLAPAAEPEAAWWAVAGGLQDAADAADVDAAAADASRIAAQTAETGAVAARTGAETAQTGAETAQTGAQTARTGAETARTGAETARDAAQAINAVTVTTGTVTGDNLILTRTNATTVDAGNVRGPKGDTGDQFPASGVAGATGAQNLIETGTPQTRRIGLGGNVTFNPLPSPSSSTSFSATIVFIQDAAGGRVVTWPTNLKWPEGVKPVVPTAPNTRHVYNILWDGAFWEGTVVGINFA